MKSQDDLEDRMTQLREAWPVDSIVEDVMARIGATAPDAGGVAGCSWDCRCPGLPLPSCLRRSLS